MLTKKVSANRGADSREVLRRDVAMRRPVLVRGGLRAGLRGEAERGRDPRLS